ncbi:MAG TPA: OmpH family outer membrane protein [Vicinamibacterales bacterium]|jgi:outer membrane protein|nr:OmpH family outer membrane protein [Vicinamibacterales bacterium]
MRYTIRTLLIAAVLAVLSASSAGAQTAEPFQVGAININYVARNSRAGKAAIAALDAFGKQKSIEVQSKAAELQKQQTELQKQSAAMSPRAIVDLQRAFEKSKLEFDRFQQDAQAEIEAMQTRFDADFRIKLEPIVDEISKEKGLHFVFGIDQAAIIWWSPGVDISDECVKRLDAKP